MRHPGESVRIILQTPDPVIQGEGGYDDIIDLAHDDL